MTYSQLVGLLLVRHRERMTETVLESSTVWVRV